MAANRVWKEYKELTKEVAKNGSDREISLAPVDDASIFEWKASITGPPDTPFADAKFELMLKVPETYPHVPPQATFVTKVFHPNVHFKTGEICLDILKQNWSPAWTLHSVCRAIIALLSDPDPSSPLNCDAGNLIRNGDERGYLSMAKMFTEMHASR
jgi:peroxin-4